MLAEDNKDFIYDVDIKEPLAYDNAIDVVETTTKDNSLPEVSIDTKLTDSDNNLLAGYERDIPRTLNLLVDEILQRSTRTRKQTIQAIKADKLKTYKARKPRTNYTLANMPRATVKVLTTLIDIPKDSGIVRLKTFKELQILLEAKQQLVAIYKEIAIYNRVGTQRLRLRKGIGATKVLRRRQVFDVKRGPNRTFSRFKARQVVREFS